MLHRQVFRIEPNPVARQCLVVHRLVFHTSVHHSIKVLPMCPNSARPEASTCDNVGVIATSTERRPLWQQ